jgi:hypothetical protein
MTVTEAWVYPSPKPPNGELIRKGLNPRERHLCAITSNFSVVQKDPRYELSPLRRREDLLACGYDIEEGIAFMCGEKGNKKGNEKGRHLRTRKRDLMLIPSSRMKGERRHKIFVKHPEGLRLRCL